MDQTTYDLIVLGSGTVGQKAAYAAADAGRRVAVIETREPGGVCANRGCDAKKPYVNAARGVEAVRRLGPHGITGHEAIRVDWSAIHRFKQSFTDPIPGRTRDDLHNAGIDLIETAGVSPRFLDEQAVEVAPGGGDRTTLKGEQFVIAVGLQPRPLDLPGAELMTTSDEFLVLEDLPPRVVFVGGGYISMEFAHAAARAGVQCTVVEKRGCPLKRLDSDMVQVLLRATRDAGIAVECDACVTRVERSGDDLVVRCDESGNEYRGDLIVHGAGRTPNVLEMNLDAAQIDWDDQKGVQVDRHLRSVSNPRVWAGGDVAWTPQSAGQFTPVAGVDGKTIAHNLLHRDNPREPDYGPIAYAVFTTPPLAQVGLTAAQAREAGHTTRVYQGDHSQYKVLRELAASYGGFKLVVEGDSRKLLGAAIVGEGSDEIINIFALAIAVGMTVDALKKVLFAYPTHASMIGSMLWESQTT